MTGFLRISSAALRICTCLCWNRLNWRTVCELRWIGSLCCNNKEEKREAEKLRNQKKEGINFELGEKWHCKEKLQQKQSQAEEGSRRIRRLHFMSPQHEEKSDCVFKEAERWKKHPVKTLMEKTCGDLAGVFLTVSPCRGSAEIREAKTYTVSGRPLWRFSSLLWRCVSTRNVGAV